MAAIKREQYVDTLVRIARIQQKMQSYYLLPIAMQYEVEERQNRNLRSETIQRVDQLRAVAAAPNEVVSLRTELRKLQKETKEFERQQSLSSSGKIRLLKEKLSLSQKLEHSIMEGKHLQTELGRLQPGGIRSLVNQLFRRKQIMELQVAIIRNDREVNMLRNVAPRPRQAKSIKKAIGNAFAEKSERELKRDIGEMKRDLNLYKQAERDRVMLDHYQGLANTRGLSLLRLSFTHLRDHLNGYGIIQRDKRVEAARSVRLADPVAAVQKHSFWQSIFRPREIYSQHVAELKERMDLYEKKVPSKAQIERLQSDIKDWSRELAKRERLRAEGRPVQPRQRMEQERTQENNRTEKQQLRAVKREGNNQAQYPVLIRIQEEEMEKLRAAHIPYQVKEGQVGTYEILDGQEASERQYKGIQVEISPSKLVAVEKVLGRSFETDPEIGGTVKYSELKRSNEKTVLMKNVPPEQIALLAQHGVPFASFQQEKNFNISFRKQDMTKVQDILNNNSPERSQPQAQPQRGMTYDVAR